MKQFRNISLAVFAAVALAAGACGNNNGGSGGGGGGFVPFVDLAVGSTGTAEQPNVSLFFNVLNFAPGSTNGYYPRADVILDAVGSAVTTATSVILTSSDLVVCNGDIPPFISGNDTILIFRDYTTLTDSEAPSVILTNGGSGIDTPYQCVVDELSDTLTVTNAGANEVRIYPNFSTIPDGTDPALTPVILNNAGSLIDGPTGIFVAGDDSTSGERDLYVANVNNTSAGEPCVTIYRDIATLVSADAPDVQLDTDVSFLGDGAGVDGFCTQLTVGNNSADPTDTNTLFVATMNSEIFVFENADTLTDNALPDVILVGEASGLSYPVRPTLVGDRLYAANYNTLAIIFGLPECSDAPAAVGFSSIHQLADGQPPSVALTPDNAFLTTSTGVATAGNALFVVGSDTCNVPSPFTGNTSVNVYLDGVNLTSFDAPAFKIPGNGGDAVDLNYAVSVSAIVTDTAH